MDLPPTTWFAPSRIFPLRERPGDVKLLFLRYLEEACADMGRRPLAAHAGKCAGAAQYRLPTRHRGGYTERTEQDRYKKGIQYFQNKDFSDPVPSMKRVYDHRGHLFMPCLKKLRHFILERIRPLIEGRRVPIGLNIVRESFKVITTFACGRDHDMQNWTYYHGEK